MDCPTPDVVAAFLAGRLTPEEISQVEAHAAGCASCLDLLATAMWDGSSGSGAAATPSPSSLPRPSRLPRPPVSLPLGSTVGRYVILELVGRGGMGEVYAAYDPELDRRVAVKLLAVQPTRVSPSEGRARLLREAKAIARLSHPNVVVVYDAGVWQDRVFIAMEFVEGETLSSWLKGTSRDWRAIRDVFVEAGRGLAAAHAAGLVHRDFKPQNVLVGRDGKVRVADFGLVRELSANAGASGAADRESASGESASGESVAGESVAGESAAGESAASELAASNPAPSAPSGAPLTEDPEPVKASLTRTGTLIGTPTYMAPEQFLGEIADVRTDQFSFCVALYEGLYRQRPFGGHDVVGLKAAVLSGRVTTTLDPSGVPAWLRRVVLRGLQSKREARYDSMEDLLAALRRDPARRARRLMAVGLVAIALVGVGIGGARLMQWTERMCGGGAQKVAAAWETSEDPARAPRRDGIRQAFVATKLPRAMETWKRIAKRLDQYAAGWTAAYADTCEATHVRGEQSAEAMDLRMACLGERLGGLKALTDALMNADVATVIAAVDAVDRLDTLDRCANLQVLRSVVPPPPDPGTRARVEALRRRLTAIKAVRDVGRTNEALADGLPLVEETRALGYPPLIAEALDLVGWLQDDHGDEVAAERSLNQAYLAAETGRDDETRADAAVQLVGVAASRSRSEDGERWAQIAAAILGRLGGGGHERLMSWLLTNRSILKSQQGDFSGALQLDEQALALKEKSLGPDSPDVAVTLMNIGTDLNDLAEYDRSLAMTERALAVSRRAYGDGNPLGGKLYNNRGEALDGLRRFGEARRAFVTAVDQLENSVGRDHELVADPLTGLGETELGAARPGDAVVPLERALLIREQHEPDPVPVARTRFDLARAIWESGGDRSRARHLAVQARGAYVALPHFAPRLREIDDWLAAHVPVAPAPALARAARGAPASVLTRPREASR